MPNQIQSIQTGQGLLKKAYPNSNIQDETLQALARRQQVMEDRVKSQNPNPQVDPTNAMPWAPKPPGALGSPGKNTPQSRKQVMTSR